MRPSDDESRYNDDDDDSQRLNLASVASVCDTSRRISSSAREHDRHSTDAARPKAPTTS